MGNGNQKMQVEFHRKANATFFSVYHGFETAVSGVSRRKEEYRFQQLKKQYAITMERELQMAAEEILAKHKNEKQANEMEPVFRQFIKDYLHRFIQKVNDQ